MAAKTKLKNEKPNEKADAVIEKPPVEEISDEEEESDVDEEGMKKLMKMLGENDLDDIAKMQLGVLENSEDEEDDDDDGDGDGLENTGAGKDEDADSEDEDVENMNEEEENSDGNTDEDGGEEDEDEDEDDEVALDDIDSVDEDAVPRQKLQIDNKVFRVMLILCWMFTIVQVALERILDTIKLDPSLPWTETLVLTYPETIAVDVNDDINRELALYVLKTLLSLSWLTTATKATNTTSPRVRFLRSFTGRSRPGTSTDTSTEVTPCRV